VPGILVAMAVAEPIAVFDPGEIRRRELGAFLRSRRERITPEQVGLRTSRRRRTPGLRREEVAQLAGVGVTWYTWLEQGRDINASPQVLAAIARALLFDPQERTHLFTLAGVADETVAEECRVLAPTVQTILDQLEPFPALAVNGRYDLIAFNRIWASGFPDVTSLPSEDRNCLWLMFTAPAWRRVVVDWEEESSRMVARYRAAMAEHVAEPAWKALPSRLRGASREFAEVWDRHDVEAVEPRVKRIKHPLVGLLELDYTYLWLQRGVGTRIVVYTPVDARNRDRLERLRDSFS
jgi:transcriptional regulator with XRE-family HTH domain